MRVSFCILSTALASTAGALPAAPVAAAAAAAGEPQLLEMAPFMGATGFPTRTVMTTEEALALTARVKAEAAAWEKSPLARRTLSDAEKEYAAGRAASTCTNPEVRVEWRRFPREHRLKWVKAVRCLYDLPPRGGFPAQVKNMAESMAYIHMQLMENIHGVGQFNAWHRLFLWHYQEILRDECGYPRELPLPWWDETKDSGKFHTASIFGSEYYGEAPEVVVGKNGKGHATCVRTGVLANLTVHLGPVRNLTTPHCLARAVNETQTAQTAQVFVDLGNSYPRYWDMAQSQEKGPHAFGHTGLGPIMGDMWASPSDAIFCKS